jgi:hypothetical protein
VVVLREDVSGLKMSTAERWLSCLAALMALKGPLWAPLVYAPADTTAALGEQPEGDAGLGRRRWRHPNWTVYGRQ